MSVKCVIVEDADFIREIYHHFLSDFKNIEIVAEAADGVNGLKAIKKHQPDILILDLVLPLKSGLDILAELSVISPKTKTLVISSLDDVYTVNKVKALGAISYLNKPFKRHDLISSVENLINSYSEVQGG